MGCAGLPIARGRDETRRLFQALRGIGSASPPVTNPMIEIDGDMLKGHSHLIGAGTMPGGHSGFFLGGYEEQNMRPPKDGASA